MARELELLIVRHGRPKTVGSDNGTELTSNAILSWTAETGVDWHFIDPGKPAQNAFIESFNGRRARPTAQLMYGVPLNDEAGLEHEADAMGARALSSAHSPPAQCMKSTPSRGGAVQLAAPGGIQHAMNSCFVAALINTFTVVRPLRNLLILTNNALAAGPAQDLQRLLCTRKQAYTLPIRLTECCEKTRTSRERCWARFVTGWRTCARASTP